MNQQQTVESHVQSLFPEYSRSSETDDDGMVIIVGIY
jgi:hypothetical protein